MYRKSIDIYTSWSSANRRQGEPCSNTAWNLVVQSVVEWVRRDAADCVAAGNQEAAENLLSKMKLLQDHVPNMQGAPEETSASIAHVELMRMHFKQDLLYSNGVAYLSSELKEPNLHAVWKPSGRAEVAEDVVKCGGEWDACHTGDGDLGAVKRIRPYSHAGLG